VIPPEFLTAGYVMTPMGPVPSYLEGGMQMPVNRKLFNLIYDAMQSVRDDMDLLRYINLSEAVLLTLQVKKAIPVIEDYFMETD
jgi:hypothetical protein